MDPNRSSRHLGQHEFEDLINLWHERAINLSSAQPRGRTTQSSKSTPRSSPKRRPLHERSSSQANSLGPTIRIVEESPSHTYNKSSLPTNPRQASEPDNAQGSTLPGSVSDEPAQPNASLTSTSQEALVPRPLQPRKAARASGSTNFSDLDTIADRGSPLFHRYSEASTAPSSPTLYEPYRIAEKLESQREDTRTRNSIQLSIRTVEPSSPASSNDRPDSTELEDTGLDTLATHSPASLQTLTKNDQASEDQSSPNYEVISSSPVQALSTSGFRGLQQASTAKKLPKPIYPPNNSSTQSLATSEYSFGSIDRPLSSSSPASNTHAALRAAIESGQPIAYPVIYPPSSSESHASFSDIEKLPDLPTFPKPIHMVEPANRDQWIPTRLSTIPSESEPRHSQSISGHSGSNGRKAENRTTIASITSSARQVPPSLPSEDALSAPLFRNGRGGPSDDSQEFDEGDDVVGELHSPPLRSQRSFFSIFSSGDSRPSSRASSRRRSTSLYDHAGFMESGLFPAWARSFYRGSSSLPATESTTSLSLPFVYSPSPEQSRMDTTASIVPGTGSGPSRTPSLTDHFPLTIYHPRKRPHQYPRDGRPATVDSFHSNPDSLAPVSGAAPAPDIRREPRGPRPQPAEARRPQSTQLSVRIRSPLRRTASGHFNWEPRLGRDRRSTAVMSAWRPPSLDSSLGGFSQLFGRKGNRQVGLFVIGFVFPFAWMVASVLPLPEKPLGEESGTREEIEARRSQAFRENRLSQLTQPGGVAVLVDPEGRGEVTVPIRGSVSLNALERAIDGTQAIELTRAREDTAVRMEAGLMRGWLETELDKIEARRKWTKARWWRRLNRIMSLIGLLLLGAIAALIVVAIKYMK